MDDEQRPAPRHATKGPNGMPQVLQPEHQPVPARVTRPVHAAPRPKGQCVVTRGSIR